MPLPDQTPRLPKWPFLISDAALLAAAWLIADQAAHPLSTEAVIAIVVTVNVALVIGVIPFLADYARRQDEALDDRQRSLEALSRTVAAAAEQISIAAGGFHEIADLAQRNLKHAEQLPHKMQEKIAEFQTRIAQARGEEDEEMEKELAALRASESERLESTADKVARAASDWARIEAASQKHLAVVRTVLSELDSRIARLRAAEQAPAPAAAEEPAAPAQPAAPPRPAEPPAKAEEPAVPAQVPEATPAAAEAPPPEAPPAKAPRKRAPKKAPPPEVPEKAEEPAGVLDEPPALALEFSQTDPDEAAPVDSISSDSATRLIVTAYIGIGNRLFIRGEGAGLSWDRGTPLQFVSIGKWRWEGLDVTAPVTYKLYKNDELECPSLGALTVEPGHQQEITATF